jgi:hypothetical protein
LPCRAGADSTSKLSRSSISDKWSDVVDGLGSVASGASGWDVIGQELDMQKITVVGVDIAKSVFQVHAIGADGK